MNLLLRHVISPLFKSFWKKAPVFITCISLVLPLAAYAQPNTLVNTVISADNTLTGTWYSTVPFDIETDNNGNIYAIGSFQTVINHPMYINNWPNGGSYLMRYSSTGVFLSGGRIGYTPTSSIVDIEADAAGNIFYVGSFNNSGGQAIEISGPSGFQQHIIDGSTSGNDYATHIVLDNVGNVYVTGVYSGNTVNFNPTGVPQYLGSGGNFLVTYGPTGNLIRGFSTPFNISAINLDQSNNIILTGTFSGTIDIDLGPGTTNLTSNAPNPNSFIAKYTQDGNLIWVNQFAWNFIPKASTSDASGNIVVTGSLVGTCDLDPGAGVQLLSSNAGSQDILLAKYDQNGAYQFAFNVGYDNGDEGSSVKTDLSGNIYVTGIYRSAASSSGYVDFDPSANSATLPSAIFAGNVGETEFLAKYGPDGTYRWVAKSLMRGDNASIDIDAQQNVIWHYEETYNTQIGASVAQLRKFDQPVLVNSFSLANSPSTTITKAPVGTYIKINGTNFSTVPSENIVTFSYNGTSISATVLSCTVNSIAVQVPPGVTPGLVSQSVQVQVAANGLQGSRNFTISVPIITSSNTSFVNNSISLITDTGRDGGGGTIIYSINSGSAIATLPLPGSTLNLIGLGTVTVAANIAGDDNYPATIATQNITSNPRIISSNAGISGTTISLSTDVGISTGAVTYTVSGTGPSPGSASVSGNSLLLNGVGTVTVTANVAADANNSASTTTQVVTILCIPTPTITLGTIPTLLIEPTTVNLPDAIIPYTSTTGSPNEYRIDWIAGGLSNIPYTPLQPGQIAIPGIPAAAGAVSYTGTLYVRNSPNSCSASVGKSITINVQISMVPPMVNGFSPASGYVGTTVTLTGNNFNVTAIKNAVFFGAAKAVVITATTTQLTVIVPSGATYQNIYVTNLINGRTGYSNAPFITTFACADIGSGTFAPKVDYSSSLDIRKIFTSDFDLDGRPDVVTANMSSATLSVYRNMGSAPITFDPAVNLTSGGSNSIAVGDLDGDGKPDIVSADYSSYSIKIFRNTSIPGTISFASATTYNAGGSPYDVAIGDLNSDGRPDIVYTLSGNNSFAILTNTSQPGGLVFASGGAFSTGLNPRGIAVGDFDADAKPDIAVANATSNSVSIFRNTWLSGSATFTPSTFPVDTGPFSLVIGDFNGDTKLDIATSGYNAGQVSVLKNSTTSSTITFDTKQSYGTGTKPYAITASDFNGDGKVDLATPNYEAGSVSILKNNSTTSTILFGTKVDFPAGPSPVSISASDLDGDGKPDILVSRLLTSGSGYFSILRNSLTPLTGLFISGNARICKNTTVGYTANVDGGHQPGYTYQWTSPNWGPGIQSANTITYSLGPYAAIGEVRVIVSNGACSAQAGMSVTYFKPTLSCAPPPEVRERTNNLVLEDDAESLGEVMEPSVFPNPANSEIVVALPYVAETDLVIRVFSPLGVSFNSAIQKGTSSKTLYTSGLPSGLYTIHIETMDGLVSKKVMIVH